MAGLEIKTDQQRDALIEALEQAKPPIEVLVTDTKGTTVVRGGPPGEEYRIELGGFGDKPQMTKGQVERARRPREHPELR